MLIPILLVINLLVSGVLLAALTSGIIADIKLYYQRKKLLKIHKNRTK